MATIEDLFVETGPVGQSNPNVSNLAEGESLESIDKSFSKVMSFAEKIKEFESVSDEDLWNQSVDSLYQLPPEQIKNYTPDTLRQMARFDFEDKKRVLNNNLKAMKQSLQQSLKQGGGQTYNELFGTPEQQQALQSGTAWRRTPRQAMMRIIRQSEDPERAANLIFNFPRSSEDKIMFNELTPEELEQYQSLLAEDIYGPDREPSMLRDILTPLTKPGEAGQAALGGALASVKEQALQPQTQEELPFWQKAAGKAEDALLMATGPVGMAAKYLPGVVARGVDVLSDSGIGQAARQTADFTDENETLRTAKNVARQIPGANILVGAGEAAARAIPEGANIGRAEGSRVADVLSSQEGIQSAREEALTRGWQQLTGPGDRYGLDRQLEDINNQIRQEAKQEVVKELGYEPQQDAPERKAFDARVGQKFKEKQQKQLIAGPLQYPDETRLASELALDPLNVVGGFVGKGISKGLGKATELASKIPGPLGAGVRKAQLVKDVLNYFPEAAQMARQGLGDEASLMRMSRDVGEAAPIAYQKLFREFKDDMFGKYLRRGGLNQEEKSILNKALRGEIPEEELPETLQKAFDATTQLRDRLYVLDEMAGVNRDITAGEVRRMAYRKNYVPDLVAKPGLEQEVKELKAATTRKGTSIGSVKAKTAPHTGFFLEDPYKQFETRVKASIDKSRSSKELKSLYNNFVKRPEEFGGWAYKIPKNSKDAKLVKQLLKKKYPTAEFVKLDQTLSETLTKIGGKPGEKVGWHDYLVPEPLAERFKQLTLIQNDAVAANKLAQGAKNFMRDIVAVPNSVWRSGVTALGGPGYHIRNATSSVVLTGLAHGVKAANPQMHLGSIAAALSSAGIGSDSARAIKFVLKDGTETTYGKLIDILDETGQLQQFGLEHGFAQSGGGKVLRNVMKGPKWLSENMTPVIGVPAAGPLKNLSIAKVGNAVENYSKIAIFGGFLEDLSSKGVARALDLTSEYAGNYKRLASWEKEMFSDTFGFYNWMRFIFPHVTKQLLKNPQRIAPFAKARNYAWRKYGQNAPFSSYSLPAYMRDLAVPTSDKIERGLGTHKNAMMLIEDPIQMGLTWVPLAERLFFKDRTIGQDISQLIGPTTRLMVEFFTGEDAMTGLPLDRLPEFDWKEIFNRGTPASEKVMGVYADLEQSSMGRPLVMPFNRMSRNMNNIYQLTLKAGKVPEASTLQMRRSFTNNYWLLAKMYEIMTGEKMSTDLMPPGMNIYDIDETRQAARTSKEAAESLNPVAYQKAKGPSWR